MKCENCGKNEVTFVYQSSINGRVTEKHLCSECAEKLGYTQRIAATGRRMMRSFFDDSFFGGSLLGSFFSPSLMDRSARLLEDPFDDFFAQMPALNAAPAPVQQQSDELVGKEEQGHFAYLRRVNALKAEMKKAVRQEDFERAAQLRDELHTLEAEHKARKEQN